MDVDRLLPRDALRPAWSNSTVLLYLGGFVTLVATLALLGILGSDHGDGALVGLAALAVVAALAIAMGCQRSRRPVTAGIFAFLAVAFFAVLVGALESVVGILELSTDLGDDYEPGTILIEVLTIAAALLALRRFRAPILVLAAALAFWAFLADLGSAFSWDDGGEVFSLLAGAVLIVAGVAVDRADRRPYGMWLHLVGGVALGGAALALADGKASWVLIGLLSLAFLAAAVAFDRTSYALLGGLGILSTATYFVEDWFGLGAAIPFFGFGEESPDPWQIALAYVFVGLVIVVLGMALGSDRMRARLRPARPPAP